jgi:hypothetical protein
VASERQLMSFSLTAHMVRFSHEKRIAVTRIQPHIQSVDATAAVGLTVDCHKVNQMTVLKLKPESPPMTIS